MKKSKLGFVSRNGKSPMGAEYHGIRLEPVGDTHLSHSRFLETNQNADWLEQMVNLDYTKDRTVFRMVSNVCSINNFNYQVCNGGWGQYICNNYHKYREPRSKGDCEHYAFADQMHFISGELADFIFEVGASCGIDIQMFETVVDFAKLPVPDTMLMKEFEYRYDYSEVENDFNRFNRTIMRFCDSHNLKFPNKEDLYYENEDYDYELAEEDESYYEDEYFYYSNSPENYSYTYYQINQVLEQALELYAQYVVKYAKRVGL